MTGPPIFFEGWAQIVRVLVLAPCAYGGLIVVLRATGKRTLSKMNAFDFVVTVAFGSIFATAILNRDVTLAESLTAIASLCLLQFVVTFASVRSARLQRLVKAEPTLMWHRGAYLEAAMRAQRVSREEVLAALRATGAAGFGNVAAVVLETDGSFSVVKAGPGQPREALSNVGGGPEG